MKRIIFVALLLFPLVAFSQNNKLKKVIKDYKDNPSFSYTRVDGDSDLDLELSHNIQEILSKLNKVHILTFEEGNSTKVLKPFNERVNKAIEKGNYETLMEISTDGLFRILLRNNKDGSPVEVVIVNTSDNDSMIIWATS